MSIREAQLEGILLDFVVMTENELQRIATGKAPGPSMREARGQWDSLCKRSRKVLSDKAQVKS